MSSSPRKKQKIEVLISSEDAETTPTPILTLFPSADPPSAKTPFTLYAGKDRNSLIAAETAEMEYESRNHAGDEGTGVSAQYMLGVHNPRTNTLTLHAAPLHSISTAVKALKALPGVQAPSQAASQRALLGTTFGTRKAIRNINAQARNRLDQDSFGTNHPSNSLQSILQNSIASSSASLPARLTIDHDANMSRPIPPYDLTATSPGDIYDMDSVVTAAELDSFDIETLITVKTLKERQALLPYRRSDFIASRLRRIIPNRLDESVPIPVLSRKDKEKVKLLIHLSNLFAFKQAGRFGQNNGLEREKLVQELGNPQSSAVVDELLERYTEPQKVGNGPDRRMVTSVMEIKLLSYMLVIMLKLDRWTTDLETVAHDLGIGSKRIGELFRSLGCSLVAPSADERAQLVASGKAANLQEAKSMTRAALKVPLTFPVERRGKAKR